MEISFNIFCFFVIRHNEAEYAEDEDEEVDIKNACKYYSMYTVNTIIILGFELA